eukprot:TRINITY_DN17975_c0_g4_i1.p1 TRINITY_DN17975_c0_g4~~TRINITY_DN17975_c0_g4_i1.p1  ORF type:complete len:249 (+),score=50.92 TRINITY_DN17975_c0_g4_i1:44-748(+)
MFGGVLDPTAILCLMCVVIPAVKEPDTTYEERLSFATDPLVVGTFLSMVLFSLFVRWQGCVELSAKDRRKARWYLWNGFVIHFLMDGCVGGLGQVPLLLKQYLAVDPRYASVATSGSYSVPVVIALLEMSIWAPLCLLSYYSMRRGLTWSPAVQLLTSALHLVGTIAFVLPEVLEGFPNIVTDPNLEFTMHHITYFWFGFGLNVLWIVVPLLYMKDAFVLCCKGLEHRATVKRE